MVAGESVYLRWSLLVSMRDAKRAICDSLGAYRIAGQFEQGVMAERGVAELGGLDL